jgi:bifunctional UDP-N-acetylglucosamine pyrophosphorylase / glucosamine-1-phosphate N-acetyltransferase
MSVSAIILAAGEGTRMRSSRPKPLHMICGRSMVMHVIYALEQVKVDRIVVVVGHGAERVTKKIEQEAPDWAQLTFVSQTVQRGTGDAALVGMSAIPGDDMDDDSTVIILPGDTPLLRPETLDELVATHHMHGHAATALTSVLDDPTGYGRVVRAPSKDGRGRVLRVVEQRDASADERAIREVWTSMCAFRRDLLGPALRRLSPDNSQGEYYLTDVVHTLSELGHQIGTVAAPESETQGVNDRWQLALAERELRSRTNRMWLLNGVTMLDPRQTFVDVTVRLGRDVTLFPGTILQGATAIGDGSEIGPDTRLVDTAVGSECTVESTTARSAAIGDRAHVGPYAALGDGSRVEADVTTGAFYTGVSG